MSSLLEINNLYAEAEGKQILKGLNLKINKGETHVIMGPNGAGKSTTANVILNNPEYKKTSGEILFEGEDISKTGYTNHRKNHICLVFQNYNLIDYLTPLENVRLVNSKASPSILLDLGLEQSQINRSVMKLSGGQQQRVAIARALVSSAPIILADEPTGNLDSDTASEIIDILKARAKERNKCVIVVTHSKEVADAADVVYELKDKKLKKRGK